MSRLLIDPKLLVICFSAALLCSAQSPTFSPLGKVVVWQGSPTPVPTPLPVWSGGAFITTDRTASIEVPTSPAPNMYVSGPQGNATVKIQLPGAVWTQNRGIARGTDGTLAASGDAKDASGEIWSYLIIFPPGAAHPIVIHTEPFAAAGLAISPDGTIWAKGADWNPPGADGLKHYSKHSTNGILRHFSATGELLGMVIPQSGLTLIQAIGSDNIAASANLTGWCQYRGYVASPQPQGGSYFEVSANGDVSKTPLPPFNDGETIDALAIADSGQVLITKSTRGAHSQLYALDRGTRIWRLVQFPSTGFEGAGYYMLGASGNKIAFWTSGTAGFTAQFAEVQ